MNSPENKASYRGLKYATISFLSVLVVVLLRVTCILQPVTIEEFTVTPSASDISQHNENKKEILFIVMGERKNFKVWFQRLNINNKNHPARVTFIYGSYDESVNATEDNVICEQSNELFDCQTLFIPGTKWTEGRNRLAEEALRKEKKRGMKYDYWGFADDDVQLICDECIKLDLCKQSFKCWNRFFATIATEGALPENASTVVLKMVQAVMSTRKWPKGFTAVSTYDAFVTVIKRDTVPLLLPYATLGNEVSEWVSQAVLFCVMKICIPGSAVKFPFMYGGNLEHRPYVRGGLELPVVMDTIHANYDPYVSFDECSRIPFLAQEYYTHVFETAEECSANIPTGNLDYCAPLLDRFTAWEESIEYD